VVGGDDRHVSVAPVLWFALIVGAVAAGLLSGSELVGALFGVALGLLGALVAFRLQR
jgi:uncharacterized membrane protein YeaQ/YmgE (transglycosylase-associated protein family)